MKAKQKKIAPVFMIALLLTLMLFGGGAAQGLVTATPDIDGRVYYTVSENDTCLSISLKTKVDIQKIRDLNKLDENCTLIANTRILLDIIQPATPVPPTPGPSPTGTLDIATITPTPFAGFAKVCVYLFEDLNGDGSAAEMESGIGGGAVSLVKKTGSENFTGLTTGQDLLCFTDVPEGDYIVSVAPPTEFNATTTMNYPLLVKAGDNSQVNFGAQKQAAFEDPVVETTQGGGRSPLMAIVGALLILAGIIIVVVFGILSRRD